MPVSFSRQDFFDLLARTTDQEGWLDPLLADPSSEAILNAYADEFVRVAQASDAGCNAGSISLAPGGSPGTCLLTTFRTNSANDAVVPKGYAFRDPRGFSYLLTVDVPVVGGVQHTVVLPLESVRDTELVNTILDPFLGTPAGSLLEVDPNSPILLDAGGNIILAPPGTPGTPSVFTLGYVSATPVLGATTDFLSANGNERGQQRQQGEPTDLYRARVRNIPDAVTPIAVSDAIQGVAQAQALPPFFLLEPFEDGATPALKLEHNLGSIPSTYDGDFLDDVAFFMLGIREGRAYFELEATSVPRDPDGLRPFFDADTFVDDPIFGFMDVSQHPVLLAGLLAIVEEANRKRAAGVQFDLAIPAYTTEQGTGSTAGFLLIPIWSLAPPAGKVWQYVDGFFGHVPNATGMEHQVEFRFEDGTIVTAPLWLRPDTQVIQHADLAGYGAPPGKRVNRVRMFGASDGINPCHFSGAFRVLEVVA